MKPLGEFLKERGWITERQLSEALSRQTALGGRLGTCLLEIGAIREDLMLKVLSEQLAVPFAEIEDLRTVPLEVRELLPANMAIQHLTIPFQASTSSADIAMLDVKNLALQDELSFVIGKRLNVHFANEARIFEALAKYYGKPCPIRFTHLLGRLNRERDRWKQPQRRAEAPSGGPAKPDTSPIAQPLSPPPRPTAATSERPVRRVAPRPKPPVRTSIPVSASELTEMGFAPAAPPGAASTPSAADLYERDQPASLSLEDVEARLERARSSKEVGRALLDWLSQEFVRVLLFKIGNGQVKGWMGTGQGLDERRLKAYQVTLDEPSIFLNLTQGGSFFLGKLPPMPPHTRLAECWNEELAHECAVFPIRLGDRLISLIYGDRDCLGLDGLELTLIQRLTVKAAIAFEMCIMQKRQRKD